MTDANTIFLRLEGLLQAWGDTSKFVIRRTMEAPTKSGVLGLICCAMGLPRQTAREKLSELNNLAMGVRIDRPGIRWWDYHTVGAKVGILNAKGEVKKTASTGEIETLITRREYLADASFLVAIQGDTMLINEVAAALASPKWPIFLGRKSCPPSTPVLARPRENESWRNPMCQQDLQAALKTVPWCPRYKGNKRMNTLACLLEWRAKQDRDIAPDNAEVWYDTPVSFDPPVHDPRLVLRNAVTVEVGEAFQKRMPPPARTRTDYDKSTWGKISKMRLSKDRHLCVFCKSPATTVQHVNYRKSGKEDNLEALSDPDLAQERMGNFRSLCRLCHDAVTMLEYGYGMGLDRINPEEPRWRDEIIAKRDEIIRFRSLETRRRRLAAEEVE